MTGTTRDGEHGGESASGDGSPLAADDGPTGPLVVDDVDASLGDLDVLDGVSTRVDPGEFVGLVGPNGAGKTTLLRVAAGNLPADRGTVRVAGEDVHALSSRAASRRVATVPQDTSVAFDFSVRDVVAMGRTPYVPRFGGADDEDRAAVDRALERTDAAALADRPVTEISGGERSRVLLGRALAQDAPVMLLDEPTASLDVNHQVETLGLVRELADDGRAVVAAIHDLDLAARFCDRLVLLSDGQVVADDAPEAVLTADRLGRAFDADAVVGSDPVTDSPRVTAFPAGEGVADPVGAAADDAGAPDAVDTAPADAAAEDTRPLAPVERVHVVAGGNVAGPVLRRLAAADLDLSVGAVPEGDADAAVARALDAELVTVPPLSGVDDDVADRVRGQVDAADVVVVAPVPLGAGQVPNLRAAGDAGGVVLVEDAATPPVAERTTDATAASLYRALRSRGVVTGPGDVVAAVQEARELTSPVTEGSAGVLRLRSDGD